MSKIAILWQLRASATSSRNVQRKWDVATTTRFYLCRFFEVGTTAAMYQVICRYILTFQLPWKIRSHVSLPTRNIKQWY